MTLTYRGDMSRAVLGNRKGGYGASFVMLGP